MLGPIVGGFDGVSFGMRELPLDCLCVKLMLVENGGEERPEGVADDATFVAHHLDQQIHHVLVDDGIAASG